jgi:RNA polymerase sigma-70 factor (sigma-E family)
VPGLPARGPALTPGPDAIGRRRDSAARAARRHISVTTIEDDRASPDAAAVVGELHRAHALALVRLATLLVGDRASAEDVVQDAFAGLYAALPRLRDPARALPYLRTAVINGCRSVHRARRRALARPVPPDPPVWSAEAAVIDGEDRRELLAAVARLPRRAREVLALRYYSDLTDSEIGAALGISRGTVSSTASRALAALARDLREQL